jgi:Alginate export
MSNPEGFIYFSTQMKKIFILFFLTYLTNSFSQSLIQINPQLAEGIPIAKVTILLKKDKLLIPTTEAETNAFYTAFGIRPGALFNKQVVEMSIKRIEQEPTIATVSYAAFNSEFNGPVELVFEVNFKNETDKVPTKKGMIANRTFSDFPTLIETSTSKLTFLLNGATGLFNETNPFFGQGKSFTQGNPIATDPAGKGTRFWGEFFLEPGIAGIKKIGNKQNYVYGSVSALISGRNSSDIYSEGSTVFVDFERMYAGILFTGLTKKKDLNIDFSVGRNFFQLNEAFLISKISGSANAGERGSVYLSSRTAFQKTALLSIHKNKFRLNAFFLEPEELFKDKQSNTNYSGGSFTFNNNKTIDAGLTYLTISGGKSNYSIPNGTIPKKGMYIINPKLYLTNIAQTGLFFKTEYAYQSHHSEDMQSKGWYAGMGYKSKWTGNPSFYYRYANMEGDDLNSSSYNRFDPVLTGGLGNWVQGINFRKVNGNGNFVTHRIEVKGNLSKKWELSLDYFALKADQLNNQGGLGPIANLKDDDYGREFTFNTRYFINNHFMLFGLYSNANPGKAIQYAFNEKVYNWNSFQLAIFMFY